MKSFQEAQQSYAQQFGEVEKVLLPVIGNQAAGVPGELRLSRQLREGLAGLVLLVNRMAEAHALTEGEDWPEGGEALVSPDLVP